MTLVWVSICGLFGSLLFADPYQILGIPRSASPEAIKKAYLEKAKQLHPDVSDLPSAEAARRFKEVQAAFDTLQSGKAPSTSVADRFREEEMRQAREKARSILESAWKNGTFSHETLESLPRYQASRKYTHLNPYPTTGPQGAGEWQAIQDFFETHGAEYLSRTLPSTSLLGLLKVFDKYIELSPLAAQAIRKGFAAPVEQSVFDNTKSPFDFLDALKGRIERLDRTRAFILADSPEAARKKALEGLAELYVQKFGKESTSSAESKEVQLAKAFFDYAFSEVAPNPLKVHELGFLINGVAPLLSPTERLNFLGNLLDRLERFKPQKKFQGAVRDIESRAQKSIERIFNQYPGLRASYAKKNTFWNRFSGKLTPCELILGHLAKSLR